MGAPNISSIFVQRVVVGVGDMAVSSNPGVVLSTFALGSCVGIVVYDTKLHAGGLLHIMLPSSTLAPEKAVKQPYMFADSGLKSFFHELRCIGVTNRENIKIVLAGGAAVLATSDMFKIGERNIEAVHSILVKDGMIPMHKELGGYNNRTLHLTLGTGELEIKMPNERKVISMQ